MANETKGDAPLTATVGEQLSEKEHLGEPSGLDVAERAVADLEGAEGRGAGPAAARREASGRSAPRPERARGRKGREGRPGVGWALAAGLGALVLGGMVRRALGR